MLPRFLEGYLFKVVGDCQNKKISMFGNLMVTTILADRNGVLEPDTAATVESNEIKRLLAVTGRHLQRNRKVIAHFQTLTRNIEPVFKKYSDEDGCLC